MGDPFIAEVRMFPYTFAPMGWAWCNGQIMNIAQNTALYALIGTTYGGDGKTTFALPDLRGKVPMHAGASQGPNRTLRHLGDKGGSETAALTESQMASHAHPQTVSLQSGVETFPNVNGTAQLFARGDGVNMYGSADTNVAPMSANLITAQGGGQPHNNMQPFLTVYFNICLAGIFPVRQ